MMESEKPGLGEQEFKPNKLAELFKIIPGRIDDFLRNPRNRVRALELAAIIAASPIGGCGNRNKDFKTDEPAAATEIAVPADQPPSDTHEPVGEEAIIEEEVSGDNSLELETGISENYLLELIREESGFQGEMVVKQINYLKEKGYLGVSVAARGDPAKNELEHAGIFAIYKINDGKVELLNISDEITDNGQPVLSDKPEELTDEQWESLIEINYLYQGGIHNI